MKWLIAQLAWSSFFIIWHAMLRPAGAKLTADEVLFFGCFLFPPVSWWFGLETLRK